MTKIFALNKTENEIEFFSAGFSGKKFFINTMPEDFSGNDSNKISSFFCFDSKNLFLKNHDFPFNGKKRIEKIIDFELEPYFPLKNELLEFDFSVLTENKTKNFSKAICIGLSKLYMDESEKFFLAKNIEISGFVPFSYYCANALLDLDIIESDSIIIVPEKDERAVFFAVTKNEILSGRKNLDTSDEENIISSINLLMNFTSLSVKESFNPQKIIVLNGFSARDKIFKTIEKNFSNKAFIFDKSDLLKKLDFFSDEKTDILHVLCGYEILKDKSLVLRRKKPGVNKFFQQYKKEILVSGFFLFLSLVLTGFNGYLKFFELENDYKSAYLNLETAVRQNFPEIKKITPSVVDQAKIEIIKARESQNENDNVSNIKKIVLLQSILNQIPSDSVELENLTILPFSVSISGIASGYDVIDSMKKDLTSDKYIKSAEIVMANTDSSGKIRFRLEIKINE
jgi:hypothetical protein